MEPKILVERLERRPFIPRSPDEHLYLMAEAAKKIRQLQADNASLSDQLQHKILCKDAEITARGAAVIAKNEEIDILEKGLRGAMAEIARISRKSEFGDVPESAASRNEV